MNHLYRLIWNSTRSTWMVAPETAKTRSKCSSSKLKPFIFTLGGLLYGGSALALDADALPGGGQITGGSGRISQTGNQIVVYQDTDRMSANWDSFDIGQNASVQFQQPSTSNVALNRVVGQNASDIQGKLDANGQVYLINPNGVVFGKTAQVNVGGLVASTLAISDADFNAGIARFHGDSQAKIDNQGQIVANHGVIALIADHVDNSGSIQAVNGDVVLAAGKKVSLDFNGDGLIQVEVDGSDVQAQINNRGLVQADGAVVMTAKAAGELINSVVNNDGIVQAQALQHKNGRILLEGDEVRNSGELTASAENGQAEINISATDSISHTGTASAVGAQTGIMLDSGNAGNTRIDGSLVANNANGKGGDITILGKNIQLQQHSQLQAKGTTGGGKVLVGGDWQGSGSLHQANTVKMAADATIDASATQTGDGGEVVLWSDVLSAGSTTDVEGTVLALGAGGGVGGRIETSGHALNVEGSRINAGEGGLWLLDPYNVTISNAGADTNGSGVSTSAGGTWTPNASGSTISNTTLNAALNNSQNVTITTTGGGAEAGDITVNGAVSKTAGSNATLTLAADRNIVLNAGISATSSALATTLTASTGSLSGSGAINTNGGLLSIQQATAGTLSGVISGTGALTKDGAGTLTLSSTNTYTGATTLNAGGLTISQPSVTTITSTAFNVNGPSTLTFNSAGRLDFSANTQISFDSVGGGTVDITGGSVGGGVTMTPGNLNITTHGGAQDLIKSSSGIGINIDMHTLTLDVAAAGGGLAVSALLWNSGALVKTGAGAASLTGINTYTGATTVNAGTLQIAGTGSLNAGNYAGNISIASGATFDEAASVAQTLSGVVSGLGTLTKSGSNTLTMSGANTYSGGTTVSGGTLKAGIGTSGSVTNGPFGTGVVTVNSGAAVDVNGKTIANAFSLSGTGVSSSGALYNSTNTAATLAGALTLNADALIQSTAGAALTLGGAINGAHALTVTTAGTTDAAYTQSGVLGGTSPLTAYTANAGTAAISLNSASTVAGPISISGGTVNLNANLVSTGGGSGTISLVSSDSILGASGTQIASNGGNIVLSANSDGSNGGAIMLDRVTVASSGGNITLGGGSDGTGYAEGSSTSYGAGSQRGIWFSQVTLNAAGGDIALRGKGWQGGSGVLSQYSIGIDIAGPVGASTIATSGSGSIHLDGIGGKNYDGGTHGVGVNFYNAGATNTISTQGGDIVITGTAGTGSARLHAGVNFDGGPVSIFSSSGNIALTGIGSSGDTGLLNSLSTVRIGGNGSTVTSGNVLLQTDGLVTNGGYTTIVEGTGTLTIAPATTGATIGLAGGSGALQLAGSLFSGGSRVFQDGFSNITIGNATSGNIIVGGALVFTDSANLVTGGDLTINAASSISDGQSGGTLALAATGNFINNGGATAVQTTDAGSTDRWIVYSARPSLDTFGSLNSSNKAIWGRTYATLAPASVGSGNRYVFANAADATITATTTDATAKVYGQTVNVSGNVGYTGLALSSAATYGNLYLDNVIGDALSTLPTVSSTGTVNTADVGSYAITAAAGVANSGYSIAYVNSGTLDITPKALTVTYNGINKVYDGNTRATVTTGDNRISGDALTINWTAAFQDKNVATGKQIDVTGVSLSGGDAGNYTVATTGITSADITRLDTVTWIGGSTGNWFDPANWAGAAVPDFSNVANVLIPSGVTVTFDNTQVVSPAANGTVNVDGIGSAGSLSISNGTLNVGNGGLSLTDYTQTGGDLTDAGSFTVTHDFNQTGSGTLTVSGDTYITDSNGGVMLGNLTSLGALTINSTDGGISQHAGTGVVNYGTTALSAQQGQQPADIILVNPGNNFVNVIARGRRLDLADVDGFKLGQLNAVNFATLFGGTALLDNQVEAVRSSIIVPPVSDYIAIMPTSALRQSAELITIDPAQALPGLANDVIFLGTPDSSALVSFTTSAQGLTLASPETGTPEPETTRVNLSVDIFNDLGTSQRLNCTLADYKGVLTIHKLEAASKPTTMHSDAMVSQTSTATIQLAGDHQLELKISLTGDDALSMQLANSSAELSREQIILLGLAAAKQSFHKTIADFSGLAIYLGTSEETRF
ncbi:hypothetical protein [Methylomonas albis]|uniref:Filamentous hemagglutinin N-terminal domain-containing protein n=1 Tax=Methylomonas albis TaxID=1854563 RepID=A0ABR9CYC6_9GAMM|nr:filamentous hemagglutinin N-terminal domain-containing protein [Methylomonas albis]MBD9354712.1 filamentous hemagglutinin N-terminal domain-containing protein [Methylomonas albis]CAD6877611.1 hypothetical protein [Methylomonas albis]